MADEAKIGDGDVPITLNGQNLVLKPCYAACLALSKSDGLVMASSRLIREFDVELMTRIVAAGLAREPDEKLGESIYNAGLQSVRDICQDYLNILANGGRRPKKEPEKKGPLESGEPKTDQ